MTQEKIKEAADDKYPSQPGKQWVRTLRNAKAEAFQAGANYALSNLWNKTVEGVPEKKEKMFFVVRGEVFIGYYTGDGVWIHEGNLYTATHWMEIPEIK